MDSHLRRFGQRLRALRQAAALSQEELAERAGLHRTYVGGIERGERNLGLNNVFRIAAALRVAPQELFTESAIAHPRAKSGSTSQRRRLR
ncbi:MAG: helix-turn-helix transcriptional regulator [Planctomycetes bacterium]|nr:helix-turn-helix transcriptional regulator [Planctomycetota bacterium]